MHQTLLQTNCMNNALRRSSWALMASTLKSGSGVYFSSLASNVMTSHTRRQCDRWNKHGATVSDRGQCSLDNTPMRLSPTQWRHEMDSREFKNTRNQRTASDVCDALLLKLFLTRAAASSVRGETFHSTKHVIARKRKNIEYAWLLATAKFSFLPPHNPFFSTKRRRRIKTQTRRYCLAESSISIGHNPSPSRHNNCQSTQLCKLMTQKRKPRYVIHLVFQMDSSQ